jgi:hypothetical protein
MGIRLLLEIRSIFSHHHSNLRPTSKTTGHPTRAPNGNMIGGRSTEGAVHALACLPGVAARTAVLAIQQHSDQYRSIPGQDRSPYTCLTIHEQIRASSAQSSAMRDAWSLQDHSTKAPWSLGSGTHCATGDPDPAQPYRSSA